MQFQNLVEISKFKLNCINYDSKMKLPLIKPTKKSGEEKFIFDGQPVGDAKLINFWKWSTSDLLSNTTRGILAEFIVAMALGFERELYNDWEPYDLEYKGIKIEIKSSAYIQSWSQKDYSKIQFSIRPTLAWDAKTNSYTSDKKKRQSDVYIFALLAHKDQKTINPLNLDQWTFYILPTKVLNEKLPVAKTISLRKLISLNVVECRFEGIKDMIKQ